MLQIKNLHCKAAHHSIIKGVDLTINPGEIHAIMGPNGAGKSTLSKVIAGHPDYEITDGTIEFLGEDITELEPEERAAKGMFVSFQYPVEVPGVTNFQFLLTAYNAIAKENGRKELTDDEFIVNLKIEMDRLNIDPNFLKRNINESFSGGEKKRNEILQMAILNPHCMVLDETDSGLDIDAMKIVANGVKAIHNEHKSLILITHYQRLLDYIKPDFVHVMLGGKIVTTGPADLALKLEEQGYDWLAKA